MGKAWSRAWSKAWFLGALTGALLAVLAPAALAQTDSGGAAQDPAETADTLRAIEGIIAAQAAKERAVETLRQRLERTDSRTEREELEAELKTLNQEVARLDAQIQGVATGVSEEEFEPGSKEFDLQAELEELIQPFVLMLKSATENARQIERLRQTVSDAERQKEIATEALAALEPTLAAAPPGGGVAARLADLKATWIERRDSASDLADAAQRQLDTRLEQQIDPAEAAQQAGAAANEAVQSFFSATGRNLILGVGAFAGVLFLLRLLKRGLIRLLGQRRARSFPGRLGALLFDVVTVGAGFASMLLVFNFYNDWLLTGLTILVLIAVGWMVLSSLPQLVEQISLLLNLGAVQEGERVMFQGAPWLVKKLDLYTDLENPALRGGTFTLPVRQLGGLHSRPMGENEVWFPSNEGDWVVLENGLFGQVVFQSPEIVQIEEEGGAIVSFTLATYLDQNPRNLSHGYRASATVGLDHAHLDRAGDEIPRKIADFVKARLASLIDPAQIRAVDVELTAVGANSLDFDIDVDVEGAAAERYEDLRDALSRFAAQCCLQNGWRIAAPQMVLRRS